MRHLLREAFHFCAIVLLCIVAAVVYGLIHDQITVRICPEYFTVLHPQVLPEDFPATAVAVVWGVIATWWVGLILGVILAMAARVGKWPKTSAAQLVQPVAILLLVMACGATVSGVTGYLLMKTHVIVASEDFVEVLNNDPDKILGAIVDGFTHGASYAFGFIGGLYVAWRTRQNRKIAIS